MSVGPCLTLGVATDYCVAITKKKAGREMCGLRAELPHHAVISPVTLRQTVHNLDYNYFCRRLSNVVKVSGTFHYN